MNNFFGIQCWLKKFYRSGARYQQYAKALTRSYTFSPEELRAHENHLLAKMVRHCYDNVPYYQETFQQLGLTPADIQTREDLKKLPIIDKKTVQADIQRFASKKHVNLLCNVGKTSGSTGMPGKFIRDFDAINFEQACVWRYWQQAGDDGKRRLSLRGDIIVPSAQEEPPFWRYNPANQEMQMSSYHLSPRNSIHYVQKVLEFQPKILYAGPSMAHVLAKFFRLHNVPYQFDAVFTSSESLEPEVRRYIEEVFQCKIFDWYGQAERVAAIGQCREGNYHIQEDYSIVELLPGQEEGSYELVGTQLHNHAMPLLRYRTQDFVYLTGDEPEAGQCGCGCSFRTINRILGRSYGYLLTPEGYHVSITAHIPIGVDNVIEAQFYQERHGEVVLKVLSNGKFSAVDREKLISNTLKHTSPHMKVFVEEVDEIPRGPNGKFINIINKVPVSLS
jgi:phenylacetate-CoA ligase